MPMEGIKDNKIPGKFDMPKETNKTLITDHKEMGIYKLLEKELRIILLRKFNKLQEHTKLN